MAFSGDPDDWGVFYEEADVCHPVQLRYNASWGPHRNDAVQGFSAFLFLFLGFWEVSGLLVFVYYRSVHQRLRKRSRTMLLITFVGVIMQLVRGPFVQWQGRETLSCLTVLFLDLLCFMFAVFPLVIRLSNFHFQSLFARAVLVAARQERKNSINSVSTSAASISNNNLSSSFFPKLPVYKLLCVWKSLPSWEKLDAAGAVDHSRVMEAVMFYKFMQSATAAVMMFALFSLPIWGMVLFHVFAYPEFYTHGCYGCGFGDLEVVFLLVESAIIVISSVVGLYQTRHYPDGLGVREEIKMAYAAGTFIALPGFAMDLFLDNGNSGVAKFDYGWFVSVGFYLMFHVQCWRQIRIAFGQNLDVDDELHLKPNFKPTISNNAKRAARIFRGSQFMRNAAKTAAESSISHHTVNEGPGLYAVLRDEAANQSFESYCESEFCSELYRFLVEVSNFERSFTDWTEKTRIARAKRVIGVFVGWDSMLPVNLSDHQVKEIKSQVQQGGTVTIDTFSSAANEVKQLLEAGPFFRFKKTEAYREFERRVSGDGLADAAA